ncbi:MAG: hypothetical protein DI528_22240 [Shinella sp.]|nr:MAG: hypothetical protein DI528_22240 [Shinella sp.]
MSMRAKMKITKVEKIEGQETVTFTAVGKGSTMRADGLDEDNTYAKFTPDAELKLTVRNPALLGALLPGTVYYLDFTRARDTVPDCPDAVRDEYDRVGSETALTFGQALTAIETGRRVARAIWMDAGAFVFLNKGSMPQLPKHGRVWAMPETLFEPADAGTTIRLPNLNMRCPDGTTLTGWAPSQNEIFARDWKIVE